MTKPAPAAPKPAAPAPAAPAPAAPVAAAPAPVAVEQAVAAPAPVFTIEDNVPVPETTSRVVGQPSPYPLAQMNVNQSFMVPVTVADTITDEAERAKAFKEQARKLANAITGAARRFTEKEGNENKKFLVRTVEGGVRCWRVADVVPAAPASV